MKVQAEVSLYPLRQNDLAKPIQQFVQVMESNNLQVKIGLMSSFVTGDSQIVFESLRKAFERLAKKYDVVVNAKISNACPDTEKG